MDKEFQLKDLLVIGEPRLMESRDLPPLRCQSCGQDNLLAFIGGSTVKTVMNKETIKYAEISHLTVHAKLRGKRMTPVLIQEIQRRFNLAGIF